MGHCIYFNEYDKDTKKSEILADFQETCEWESDSRNYHGNLTLHPDIICDSRADAEAKIEKLDKGWYDDHGVLFRDTHAVKPNAAIKKLKERIVKMKADECDYVEKNHVWNRKSAYIGCPECGSKLSREHLHQDKCPLCRTDLRSETIKARVKKYDADIRELEGRVETEYKKLKDKAPVKWLVKCEFHM